MADRSVTVPAGGLAVSSSELTVNVAGTNRSSSRSTASRRREIGFGDKRRRTNGLRMARILVTRCLSDRGQIGELARHQPRCPSATRFFREHAGDNAGRNLLDELAELFLQPAEHAGFGHANGRRTHAQVGRRHPPAIGRQRPSARTLARCGPRIRSGPVQARRRRASNSSTGSSSSLGVAFRDRLDEQVGIRAAGGTRLLADAAEMLQHHVAGDAAEPAAERVARPVRAERRPCFARRPETRPELRRRRLRRGLRRGHTSGGRADRRAGPLSARRRRRWPAGGRAGSARSPVAARRPAASRVRSTIARLHKLLHRGQS